MNEYVKIKVQGKTAFYCKEHIGSGKRREMEEEGYYVYDVKCENGTRVIRDHVLFDCDGSIVMQGPIRFPTYVNWSGTMCVASEIKWDDCVLEPPTDDSSNIKEQIQFPDDDEVDDFGKWLIFDEEENKNE